MWFSVEYNPPWLCWQAWVQYNILQASPAICRHFMSAILRAPRPATFSIVVPAIFVSTMGNHRGWDFVFIATCRDDSSNVNNLIFATFFVKYLNISCYFDTSHPLQAVRAHCKIIFTSIFCRIDTKYFNKNIFQGIIL